MTDGLDPALWVAEYLPQWTTPERARARYGVVDAGLELRIDADQPDWRPEDAPLRVSNLQTARSRAPSARTAAPTATATVCEYVPRPRNVCCSHPLVGASR